MTHPDSWQFDVTDLGMADLVSLDSAVRKRVLDKLKRFIENFQNITPLPLSGNWRGFFKLRVGDWRVVYEVNNDTCCIVIHAVDNRDKIYKQRR